MADEHPQPGSTPQPWIPQPSEPPHEVHAIGAPARRALTSAGLTTWDAVAATADADLLALHGFGPRALGILRGLRPHA